MADNGGSGTTGVVAVLVIFVISSLSTPRLRRCVELNGEDVGLPVSRIEVPR